MSAVTYERTARPDGTFYIKPEEPPFATLEDAGVTMGEKLIKTYGDKLQNAVVHGCVRGGLPGASQVALKIKEYLEAKGAAPEMLPQFEMVIIRKFNLPESILHLDNFSIGAVTETGEVQYMSAMAKRIGIDLESPEIKPDLDKQIAKERAELERRKVQYRGDREPLKLEGKLAIIYDDGMANGTTMKAALASVRARNPEKIIVAVPVCSEGGIRLLVNEATMNPNDICYVECSKPQKGEFWNTDDFYKVIRDVTDKEVIELMAQELAQER